MSKVLMHATRLLSCCAVALSTVFAGCAPDAAEELAQGKLLLHVDQGRVVDAPQALAHLRRAADQHSAAAAYHLGLLYRRGAPGVDADPSAAMRWLRVAAQANVLQAQFMLGQMLVAGEGGIARPLEARAWFEKAAEHDHPEANLELAMAHRRGDLGVKPDEAAADRYLMEAQHALKHRPVEP